MSKGEALFLPRIGVVVVAEALPEAGPVEGHELDRAKPLRALPEVLVRDHEPERKAVVRRERLAVGVSREQGEIVLERLEWNVRGEVVLCPRDDEAGARQRPCEPGELAPVNAFEPGVEA